MPQDDTAARQTSPSQPVSIFKKSQGDVSVQSKSHWHSDSMLTLGSEFKLSQYEVTETVANHIFTEGGFQKKEVLMTQSVMFVFCTSLKTHKKQRSCKPQNLPRFDNKPSTHHFRRV